MKKVFLLFLILAFVSCEKSIEEIGMCIYKNPKVQKIAGDIMVAIMKKDFSELLPKLKEFLPDAIDIILGCLKDEENEEPLMQAIAKADNCVWSCKKYSKNPKNCCKTKCTKSC